MLKEISPYPYTKLCKVLKEILDNPNPTVNPLVLKKLCQVLFDQFKGGDELTAREVVDSTIKAVKEPKPDEIKK